LEGSLSTNGFLYKVSSRVQRIVCKRFSSLFVNQRKRGGLPCTQRKCFENKDFSGSPGNERRTYRSVIRSLMKQLTMRPSDMALTRPSDRSQPLNIFF
jgi:hypothetical protein